MGFAVSLEASDSIAVEITLTSQGLPKVARVELPVFDPSGRLVQRLYSGESAAGVYEVTLDSGLLASGVYLVRLEASGQVSRFKVALVK